MKIIKNAIIWIVFGIFIVSSLVNISNQFIILTQAKQKNLDLENEINELSGKNQRLKKQIEYATSSAFLEESIRKNFGMGTEDDYWVR